MDNIKELKIRKSKYNSDPIRCNICRTDINNDAKEHHIDLYGIDTSHNLICVVCSNKILKKNIVNLNNKIQKQQVMKDQIDKWMEDPKNMAWLQMRELEKEEADFKGRLF